MSTEENQLQSPWQKQSKWINWGIGLGVFVMILIVMALIPVTPSAKYENKHYGISVKYPAFWKAVNEPIQDGIAVFVSPKEDEYDWFTENVNISFVAMTTKDISLDNFTKLTIHQMTGTFGDYLTVLKSAPAMLGGRPGYQFMYVGKVEGAADQMQYWHVWTLTPRGAYIVTLTSPSASFKKYYPIAKSIVRSFRFLDM